MMEALRGIGYVMIGLIVTGFLLVALWVLLLGLPTILILFGLPLGMLLVAAAIWRVRRANGKMIVQTLAQGARSGLPLPELIGAAAADASGYARHRLQRLRAALQVGEPLHRALRQYVRPIDHRTLSLVAWGERTGQLAGVLDQLDREPEAGDDDPEPYLTVAYLMALVMVLGSTLNATMIFVVPKFREIFADFDTPLPASMVWLMDLSYFLSDHLVGALLSLAFTALLLFLPVAALFWAVIWPGRGPLALRWPIDTLIWLCPGLRAMSRSRGLSDLCRSLAAAVPAGISLEVALEEAKRLHLNTHLRRRVDRWRRELASGRSLAEAARAARLSSLLAGMLDGVTAGSDAAATFRFCADYYQTRFSRLATAARAVLLPAVVLLGGALVGFYCLAIIETITQLISALMDPNLAGAAP